MNKNIEYTEYICEDFDKNIQYEEYIAECIEGPIKYSEYIAEALMTDAERLKKKREKIRQLRNKKLKRISGCIS